jgi:excisionase family DNA binding protein
VSDVDPEDLEDPWPTVAEIASELHVNPAKVRLWVSKGKLSATRAGERKLIIRRSDLNRMLEASQPRASGVVDSSLCLRRVELFQHEREISQQALLAELDGVLAHIREPLLLVCLRGRRAINARERGES